MQTSLVGSSVTDYRPSKLTGPFSAVSKPIFAGLWSRIVCCKQAVKSQVDTTIGVVIIWSLLRLTEVVNLYKTGHYFNTEGTLDCRVWMKQTWDFVTSSFRRRARVSRSL